MVRLVEHHEVPGRGVRVQCRGAFAPSHQVARGDHDGLFVPSIAIHDAFVRTAERRGGVAHELATVVDRPVEVELLTELDLPLAQHGLRCEHQDPFRAPREPCLSEQHPGFNRFPEPDFVRDQQLRGPTDRRASRTHAPDAAME